MPPKPMRSMIRYGPTCLPIQGSMATKDPLLEGRGSAPDWRKSPAAPSDSKRDSTSRRSAASVLQAESRNRGRCSTGSASASSNIPRICCHLSGFNGMPRRDLTEEPRTRGCPVALYSGRRNAQNIGGVFNGKPAEEAELHDFALLRV